MPCGTSYVHVYEEIRRNQFFSLVPMWPGNEATNF